MAQQAADQIVPEGRNKLSCLTVLPSAFGSQAFKPLLNLSILVTPVLRVEELVR